MADRCLLYYITGRRQFSGDEHERRRALLAKIAEATRAGVNCIQLREKDLSTRELEALTRESVAQIEQLRSKNRKLKTILLVNSRTDVAIAANADGVHLRSDDISPDELRSVWVRCSARVSDREPLPFIAVSCHSVTDVLRAKSKGADFVVFAPVFEKRDAPATQPKGLSALREACAVKIPVLALGGVTLENAASCLAEGASGIAGIRLFQENKIEDVVRALRGL